MMKLIVIPVIFMLILLLLIGAIAMAFVTGQPEPDPGFSVGINLSDEVMALKPLVLYHARYFGVEDFIWYLLAIIQVESGGLVEDVMQSSESLGLPPNSLSREESVRQGVRYFSQLLSRAEHLGADMDTVLQSYNFGIGVIDYVGLSGGQYTFELAMSFARRLSGGVRVTYTNPIAVAENGGWRYNFGNFFYVRLVRSHLIGIGSSGFIWPTPGHNLVTSLFGNRRHPITGVNRMHSGIDIGAPFGAQIVASAGGVVNFVGYERGGFGNWIQIDHGNGFMTRYAHNARNRVRLGDRVVAGQHIADVGSTGSSTGAHLHFEILENGVRVDPLQFFPENMFRIR